MALPFLCSELHSAAILVDELNEALRWPLVYQFSLRPKLLNRFDKSGRVTG